MRTLSVTLAIMLASSAFNFPGLGTLINIATILIGTIIGIFVGERLKEDTRSLITDVLGLVTMLGAASAIAPLFTGRFAAELSKGWSTMPILLALLVGGIFGSIINLEGKVEDFGGFLKRKFRAREGSFVEGFLDASLLFAIGPLAILGSISDGMGTGIDQLILKSTLDGFASIAFASSLGWGVAASAIPVGIYQGTWTLIGLFLGNIMADYQVDAMTITGGLLLLAIGMRLLKIKMVPVGNLLPALFLAPVFALVAHQFL